jgi:hypothetical protein
VVLRPEPLTSFRAVHNQALDRFSWILPLSGGRRGLDAPPSRGCRTPVGERLWLITALRDTLRTVALLSQEE